MPRKKKWKPMRRQSAADMDPVLRLAAYNSRQQEARHIVAKQLTAQVPGIADDDVLSAVLPGRAERHTKHAEIKKRFRGFFSSVSRMTGAPL